MKTSKKLAFASADIFGGGSFNIINFMYPTFLALAVGLNPFLCSVILLITGVIDAITDPIMGKISDRTHNKRFGKRRIYMIIAAPLVAITFFMVFFPFSFSSEILRFSAVLIAYIAFDIAQTMAMIPYYSLTSEISGDYTVRASANAVRLGFSIFSSILCVAVAPIIPTLFEGNIGYIVMSAIFGTLFMACILVTGFKTREEIIVPPSTTKFTYKEIIKPFKLKSFRNYFGMFVLLQLTMAIMSGLFFFYVNFYYIRDLTLNGTSNMVAMIAAALIFLVQILALPFYMKIIKKHSKAAAYRVGVIIWIAISILVFFMQPGWSPLVLYAATILMGFGISGPGLAPHTMFGDVADEAELVYGERMDGFMSGIANFSGKIAQSIGLAIMMAVLGLCGFVSANPGETVFAQPENALTALKIMLCVSPIIFMGMGFLLSTRYKIDKKRHDEISTALQERKNHKDK